MPLPPKGTSACPRPVVLSKSLYKIHPAKDTTKDKEIFLVSNVYACIFYEIRIHKQEKIASTYINSQPY